MRGQLQNSANSQNVAGEPVVKRNADGRRVGQSHPQAKLTDHEVELMRRLHDQGMGYRRLAAIFEVPRTRVQRICTYKVRTF